MASKPKAIWDDMKDQLLLRLLIQQIKAGKRADNGFKKEAWIQITSDFNAKFEPSLEKEQVKSRAAVLKKRLDVFQKLCDNSGFGWDQERRLPTAPDDVWEAYIQSHKEARQFRHKTLLHYELLYEIFSKTVTTGNAASATALGFDQYSSRRQATISTISSIPDIELFDPEFDSDNEFVSTQIDPNLNTPIDSIDSSKRLRGTSDSPPTMSKNFATKSRVKKPRTATHAAVEGIHELAEAFRSSKQIRAPPPITKLEQALELMGIMLKEGELNEDEYMNVYELMRQDEKHAVFFCSAPAQLRLKWLRKTLRT